MQGIEFLSLPYTVADLEGVPWFPWNPPFAEDQPAHGTVFSREI